MTPRTMSEDATRAFYIIVYTVLSIGSIVCAALGA